MELLRRMIAAGLLAAAWPAAAAAEVYEIADFDFERGGRLETLRVDYATYGRLNEARDNAILVTHGTSGSRDSYADFIGPGRAFDTDRYFVVAVDAIGGGESSAPSDGLGTGFPPYTIRDMVAAQHRLLVEGLGVARLVAVGGASMGAFQALEWGVQHPDFVEGLLVIAGAPETDRLFEGVIETMIAAMQLDPAWDDGDPATQPADGLRVAGMVFAPWLYSDAFLEGIGDDEAFAGQLRAFGAGWAESWDAADWMYRYRASQSHDLAAGFEGDLQAALGAIAARTLILHVASDRLFPERHARRMADGIAEAELVVIESDRGHMGCCQPPGTPEYEAVNAAIRAFLAASAS